MHPRCRQPASVAWLLLGVCAALPLQARAQLGDSVGSAAQCNNCIHVPFPVADTTRHLAIEYSDAYYTRLTIHRIGSYVELPLFATEYLIGQKLIAEERDATLPHHSSLANVHGIVAGSLGVLFTANTVTGLANLIESRHNPEGRARRWIHGIAMLAADAGFFWAAAAAGEANRSDAAAAHHRNIAIGSMSIATASTLMMWLWKQ